MTDEKKYEGLPVPGYRPQTADKLALVAAFKYDEERLLRKLDDLDHTASAGVDERWLAIGRTHLEQAFMAINRSIFRPARVELPQDAGDDGMIKGE